ncbi:polyphenol oxidase, chloroplastic-like [Tasmannia lanceolata]|uniref:polyphenol oxidase, chloroplastic-like n=1 Tax=Tasmannia lanceolata TaxID=3420 RepID=UPI004064A47D
MHLQTFQNNKDKPTMSLPLLITSTPPSTFSTKKNPLYLLKRPQPSTNHYYSISCNGDGHMEKPLNLDRRDVLLGLGGLYGSTLSFHSSNIANAKPIQPPNIGDCGPANLPANVIGQSDCCPPNSKIVDFKFPPKSSPLRQRRPAHLVGDEYMEKYARATALMKQLDPSDPRNFMQQANVHCAYCDGAYVQVLDVHNSWLFFPWHRFYLYFYERILGKLIGDETFALPFWNYDTPAGMSIPRMYVDRPALFDSLRDPAHQPPALVDFNYNLVDTNETREQRIKNNLTIMYRQVVLSRTPRLFLGAPYRAGEAPDPGAGSFELVPHNIVHLWVGDRAQPNLQDMGIFYSAARDPIFFAHHANVDRIWYIWRGLGGKNRRDYTDRDWLNAGFLFYDENAQLVRVKISDCLDIRKLRYTYEDVALPWLNAKPKPTEKGSSKRTADEFGTVSRTLSSTIRAKVKRPRRNRSKMEKERQEEVIVVDGIECRTDVLGKFDVYINVDDEYVGNPGRSEFVGSFVNVPHGHSRKDANGNAVKMTTRLRLGITDCLDNIGADGDGEIVVTMTSVAGNGADIAVGALRIEFDP